jgi:hypothetical protein
MDSNNTNDDIFCHSPLNHGKASIRLVTLLPRLSHDGLIRCHMSHTTTPAEQSTGINQKNASRSREPREKYSCVSYTWGKADGGFPIRINEKVFRVRENLFWFLKLAWKERLRQDFWIDALCIDQSNVLERNHQVQQMGQIFAQAEEVIMWLGRKPELESTLQRLGGRSLDGKIGPDDYGYPGSTIVFQGQSSNSWLNPIDTRIPSSRNFSPRRSSPRRSSPQRYSPRRRSPRSPSPRRSYPRLKSVELAGPYGTFCNDEYWSRACK